jgi:hypothetical protein
MPFGPITFGGGVPPPGSVGTAQLADGAVTTPKLADNAVTNPKLADMAQGLIKGRTAGAGTGDPQDLARAAVNTITQPDAAPAQESNAAQIGPADPVTFTTTSIASTKSGLFYIFANIAANASGVSTQTGTLRLDVAGADTVLDTQISGTGGAGPFNMSFGAVVQVTAGTSHTFSVRADANAGTNTVPIGNAVIAWIEF